MRKPLEPGHVAAVVSYKAPPSLHNRLDVFAQAQGVKKGTASRMLVENALHHWETMNRVLLENEKASRR